MEMPIEVHVEIISLDELDIRIPSLGLLFVELLTRRQYVIQIPHDFQPFTNIVG